MFVWLSTSYDLPVSHYLMPFLVVAFRSQLFSLNQCPNAKAPVTRLRI